MKESEKKRHENTAILKHRVQQRKDSDLSDKIIIVNKLTTIYLGRKPKLFVVDRRRSYRRCCSRQSGKVHVGAKVTGDVARDMQVRFM